MPYPFDETFAASIPAGFGAAGGAGGVTPSYNAGQQSADLVYTATQSFWRITEAAQAADFWFEMDVEIVSSTGAPSFGLWLHTSPTGYEGHRIAVESGTWFHSYRSAANTETEKLAAVNAAWAVVGARRVIRIDAKRSGAGFWDLQLSVAGVPVWRDTKSLFSTFLPCIFGTALTLRLHRAAGATPSALPAAPALGVSVAPIALMRRPLLSPAEIAGAPRARGLPAARAWRSAYFSGNGVIAASVKEKGTPDLPLRRRVLLISENTGLVVAETLSDASTGAYRFEWIDPTQRYTVMSYDNWPRVHRAEIADNLTPDLMP